jgi:hypothetical protein
LTPEDWIWREGLKDWFRIGDLEIVGVPDVNHPPNNALLGNSARSWREEVSVPVKIENNYSFSQRWVRTIPRRWFWNGAILGALLAFAPHATSTELLRITQSQAYVIRFLLALALMALFFSAVGGLAGFWARWSLTLDPADWPSVPSRIYRNWLIGALTLATILILIDAALKWYAKSPIVSDDHIENIAYLLGSYGAAALAGFVVAVVSRRGLTRSLEDDDNFIPRKPINSPNVDPPLGASFGQAHEREAARLQRGWSGN